MKKGNIYSITSYWTIVEEADRNGVIILEDVNGKQAKANEIALKEAFISGDSYSKEEKVTKTELNDLILKTVNTVITINFDKKDTPKTKKDYLAELDSRAESLKNEFLSKGVTALKEALANPVLDYTPGENRTIRGYHITN